MPVPDGATVAETIERQPPAMVTFHGMLRTTIRHRRLTLQVVCKHLAALGYKVGVSTLGDWQHGKARPASMAVVNALEMVLGLPPDTLTQLIPSTELSEQRGPLGELLVGIPGSRDRTVDVLSQQNRARVNETGHIWRIGTQLVLRARRDGVDRYVVWYFADPGSTMSLVDVEAVANCTVGLVRWHKDVPLMVAELHFGQRLRAGDTWLLEYRTTNVTGQPSSVFAYAVRHRTEHYLLEVVFDPAAPPAACQAFTQSDLYEPARPSAALEINAHNTVHLLGTPLLTGLYGIQWRSRA